MLLGIDAGTTYCKAVVVDAAGRVLGEGRARTPWTKVATGAEVDPDELVDACRRAAAAAAPGRIEAVGVAGMAETGVLLDAAGRALAPAIAWHDRRGADEARAFGEALPDFSRRTGLAPGPLCTLAKLAGQRELRAARWLGVPEYVAHRLGAEPAAERSLASRTGLFDVAAAQWWAPALEWLEAPAGLLAPPVAAGTCLGRTADGAAIAVAGHDHVVAMVGAGALRADDLLHSAGTAEAYVRTCAAPVTEQAVASGLSCGRHVLPDRFALLGGGLVDASLAAALGADVVARMNAVAGPHGRLLGAGGGVRRREAREAKERRLGPIEWSPVHEATARGAALIAGLAAGVFADWGELAAPALAGAASAQQVDL